MPEVTEDKAQKLLESFLAAGIFLIAIAGLFVVGGVVVLFLIKIFRVAIILMPGFLIFLIVWYFIYTNKTEKGGENNEIT